MKGWGMTLVKETPPTPKRSKRVDWPAAVREMKASPGDWFNIGEFSPGIANHIRKGQYRAFLSEGSPEPPEVQVRQRWEVTARVVDSQTQRVALYIRYLG
jgi:hypothetical protein